MKINDLGSYTYDFYEDTCKLLKSSGFYPKRILDIGANACETADVMRQFWPASDMLLIEGNRDCEPLFKLKKYNYHIKLLGKENGTTTFYKTKWSPICSGNSIYRENSNVYDGDMLVTETLPIYKLDDVVVGTYDLIKIDTQGSELDIIRGGMNTFSNAKVVICEVALVENNVGGCKKEDVMNVLTKELKYDYIRVIESVLSSDSQRVNYENLLFIKL
jgi:FkbM family methyltransferase